jgi:hypothetical protein
VSYNARAVKIYAAFCSLVHFGNKKMFKNALAYAYYSSGVVVVKSKVVGPAPDFGHLSSRLNLKLGETIGRPTNATKFC